MDHKKTSLPLLALTALGVVFGDIGTSPLYAFKEIFHATHGLLTINETNIIGILSVIFWSLMIMVTFKYVMVIMRADNNGEGGIMAMLALNLRNRKLSRKAKSALTAVGLFGAALFFGDGVITPAISVLSAVEGLQVATTAFDRFIIPIAIGILTALFLIQKKGTGAVGKYFGPITLVWFLLLGGLGLYNMQAYPQIMQLLNPAHAISFISSEGSTAFFIMGAVVLTITGGEALYADMGHFGRRPIQLGWYGVVLPCLTLNYAGQGALLLTNHAAQANPFFMMTPKEMLYPVIILATIATIIASQAVISGVFSVARQAIQLGYLPRMEVQHTSESEIGQIYVPLLNWILLVSVIILVLAFKSSTNLAAAYGIAVTMTMICDTILVAAVMLSLWKWHPLKIALVTVPILLSDLVFFAATTTKFFLGGYIPLFIGSIAFTIMMIWKRGRQMVMEKLKKDTPPLDAFIESVSHYSNTVSGTAVFMIGAQNIVPAALLHNLKHNKILHEHNILMTVVTRDVPYTHENERTELTRINDRFSRVVANYGFKEQPDIPHALSKALKDKGLELDMMSTSFFVSRERVFHNPHTGMAPWREKLFISMTRNTSAISDFFQIPMNRVVEIGSQIEI